MKSSIKKLLLVCLLIALIIIAGCKVQPDYKKTSKETLPYEEKKILYIDSYHEGYEWSDGIMRGVRSKLNNTGVELEIHMMDTKNNPSEEFKEQAAIETKSLIEQFEPDVVIACDDNAFKYVVMPYYKDADLPFVFCGLNWDASVYGAPYKNTAGMVEVVLLDKAVDEVKEYADGEDLAFLTVDVLSEHKNAEYYETYLGFDLKETVFVDNFEDWKTSFTDLQKKVDILILGVPEGIKNFNEEEAEKFVLDNVEIPIVVEHDWLIQYGLLAYSKIAEEQGEWSAETALRILDGTNPSDIPVTTNKKGKLALNLVMADKLGIAFRPGLIKNADVIKR
jgi:hypothetical protein